MQITADLKAPAGRSDATASSSYFRALGSSLSDADGNNVAVQQSGVWRGSAGLFAWIDFKSESPFIVRFKNVELGQEERFGPAATLRVINGSMWTMGGTPELIAQYDPTLNIWHMVSRPAVGMPQFSIERGER